MASTGFELHDLRSSASLRARTSLGVVPDLSDGSYRVRTRDVRRYSWFSHQDRSWRGPIPILFAPLAFAPERQDRPREPPSPPVFLPISAHFTATPGIPLSPTCL